MRITPPAEVKDPVTVFIADYGMHGSLILPRDDGQFREFAYGEYDWFALNHDQWYNAIPIILYPHKATLGTRMLAGPVTVEALQLQMPVESIFELRVEQAAAQAGLQQLESRYEQNKSIRGEIYNPAIGLNMVEDPKPYSMCNNCNIELAAWLEMIGCRVDGWRTDARFEFVTPR